MHITQPSKTDPKLLDGFILVLDLLLEHVELDFNVGQIHFVSLQLIQLIRCRCELRLGRAVTLVVSVKILTKEKQILHLFRALDIGLFCFT